MLNPQRAEPNWCVETGADTGWPRRALLARLGDEHAAHRLPTRGCMTLLD
jgi:hypothetical protein